MYIYVYILVASCKAQLGLTEPPGRITDLSHPDFLFYMLMISITKCI